jgi:hypothetical protein
VLEGVTNLLVVEGSLEVQEVVGWFNQIIEIECAVTIHGCAKEAIKCWNAASTMSSWSVMMMTPDVRL